MASELPIYMHVNYLENAELSFEQICRLCAKAGYAGIELRDRDRSGRMSLNDYLPHVAKCARDAGLKFTFGLRNDTTNADPAVRQAAMQAAEQVIVFASEQGIDRVNFFAGSVLDEAGRKGMEHMGSKVARPEHWERTVAYVQQVGDFAAGHGVTLCLEMRNGYIHDLAEPTVKLLQQIDRPNVKANFDYGNIFLHPCEMGLARELEHVAPYIGYVHVKNMAKYTDPSFRFATPLRDGQINHFVLIRRLLGTGYRGIITIENTMSGDKRALMHEDLAYLRCVLADCQELEQNA